MTWVHHQRKKGLRKPLNKHKRAELIKQSRDHWWEGAAHPPGGRSGTAIEPLKTQEGKPTERCHHLGPRVEGTCAAKVGVNRLTTSGPQGDSKNVIRRIKKRSIGKGTWRVREGENNE